MTALDESVTRTRGRNGFAGTSALRRAAERLVTPARPATASGPSKAASVTAPPVDAYTTLAAASPRVQPALEQRQLWERRYRRRLRFSDTGVVVGATALAAWLHDWVLYYAETDTTIQLIRGIAMVVSAAVIVAGGSVLLTRSLRRAGVLEGFPD